MRLPAPDDLLTIEQVMALAPAFACTPELFPDLVAAAIQKRDIGAWAAEREMVTSRAEG